MMPVSDWFNPAARPRKVAGTSMAVLAVAAGCWNACIALRTNIITYRCQSSTDPLKNRAIRRTMHAALTRSAPIMIARRLHRSASVPPSGPSKACGSKATSPAVASAETLPVVSVIHHSNTNWVSAEPISDTA